MLSKPRNAALIALIFTLPIALIASAIFFEIAWLEMFLKSFLTNDGDEPNTIGRIVMGGGLLLLPVAFAVSILPMLRRGVDGKRHFYVANVVVALLAATLMVPTWGALGEEVYRCEVLNIPNCD